MWKWLVLALYGIVLASSSEDYALRSDDDCFALRIENLRHHDEFQTPAVQYFLTSFQGALSLELTNQEPEAFKHYVDLVNRDPTSSYPLLTALEQALYDGCECKMASSGKNKKKPKKGKNRKPIIDATCNVGYAFYFLGTFFKNIQHTDEALECFVVASQINPSFGEAFANAGTIYLDKGDAHEALPYFQRASEIYPNKFYTHYYTALALAAIRRIPEAIEKFDKALSTCTNPNDRFTVLLAYATTLHRSGRSHWDKAEELYSLAKAMATSSAARTQVLSHHGSFLKERGEYNKSVAVLQQAVDGNPNDCGYRINLAHALEARRAPGDLASALSHYESSACASHLRAHCDSFVTRQKLCAWGEASSWAEKIRTASAAVNADPLCVTPAMAVFCEWEDPKTELEISRNFAKLAETNVGKTPKHSRKKVDQELVSVLAALHTRNQQSDTSQVTQNVKRVKIGYISSYFYDHIVGFILEALLPLHDRNEFEVFAYALNPKEEGKVDSTRDKIAASVEHFVDVSLMNFEEVAEQIYEDEILILINMDGHMPGMPQEILALTPAPVQIAFLGFPGSSGSNYTQYIVADKSIIPPKSEYWQYYTEKVIYMPYSYLPTQHSTTNNDVTRTVPTEREGPFKFCSINQLVKLDPTTYNAWQNILKKVPNSVLWLQKHPPDAVPYLSSTPNPQVIFLDRTSTNKDYLALVQQCDLFLDPLKYNSHTTGADSLWMGVPLLTMPGQRFASRVGAGLLQALDCKMKDGTDLATVLTTPDLTEYEDRAVLLATNHTLWRDVKESLAACVESAPLFDLRKWVKDWERGLVEAGYTFANKAKPDHIFISPRAKT